MSSEFAYEESFLKREKQKVNANGGWTENKIGDKGALSLTEAMRHNLQIKTLCFGCLSKIYDEDEQHITC